jgi:hypothetical protein
MNKSLHNFGVIHVVAAIFLLSLLFILSKAIKNYHGFCSETNGYIKDDKKIENAIEYVMSLYPPVTESVIESNGIKYLRASVPENPLHYVSVAEFKKINPDCCEITVEGRRGFKQSFYDRLGGRISGFVKIKYLLRQYDENSNFLYKQITTHVAVSNCGRPWSGYDI